MPENNFPDHRAGGDRQRKEVEDRNKPTNKSTKSVGDDGLKSSSKKVSKKAKKDTNGK